MKRLSYPIRRDQFRVANGRVTIVNPREPGDRLQDELLVHVGEVFDVVDLVPYRAQLVLCFVMRFGVIDPRVYEIGPSAATRSSSSPSSAPSLERHLR